MDESGTMQIGPHTPLVYELLKWIDRGELLRFGTPPSGPFILVSDFEEAQAIAQGRRPELIDWTSLRDNADASLYEVGLLDTEPWLPYKAGIKSLLYVVSDKVDAVLPTDYLSISDDVIADLHTCAVCVAVHGRLDPFHGALWKAYTSGGWPCGCTADGSESQGDDPNMDDWHLYVFWRESAEKTAMRVLGAPAKTEPPRTARGAAF